MSDKHLLLVEDDNYVSMGSKLLLEKYGYRVTLAANGKEAVTVAAADQSIDLILMDVDLGPGMDGTEAAGIILRDRDIPVIFLSGHTEREIVEKTERITSYGYVVKNTGITVLDASIKMAFRLYDAKMQAREKDAALKESEERYRSLFNNNHSVMLVIDPDSGIITDANPAAVGYYGWVYDTLVGTRIQDINQFSEDAVKREMEAARLEERSFFRFRHILSSGDVRDVEVHSGPILIQGKEYLCSIIHDVSEKAHYEQRLRTLDFIIRNSPVVAFVWKNEKGWPVEFVSDNISRFGYSPRDFHSGRIPYTRIIHPDDIARVGREVAENSARGDSDFTQEYRILTKAGEVRHIHDGTWVLRNPDGQITHYQGILWDITERVQAEESLRNAYEENRALLQELKDRMRNGQEKG